MGGPQLLTRATSGLWPSCAACGFSARAAFALLETSLWVLPVSAGCLPASCEGSCPALLPTAAVPAAVTLHGLLWALCAEEVCTSLPIPSVASQTPPSSGAPCAVLRSAAEVYVATGGLPPVSACPVYASDEDGCPLRLSGATSSPTCAPGLPGMEPGWAASAWQPCCPGASAPAAALAACAAWLPGLSGAAAALLSRPAPSQAAAPAGSAPALLASTTSASTMACRTSSV